MTKPSIVTVWATDAAYVGGTYDGETNKATPGATLIAQGWGPNVKPTAQNFNQRFNAIGTWLQYLNDGAFEGASSFNSTLGVTGAVLMSSTLGVTGLITATAGLTCAANQHINQSGTGEHKHGDKVLPMSALSGDGVNWNSSAAAGTFGAMASSGAGNLFVPIELIAGDRIKSVTYWLYGDGVADMIATVYSSDATRTVTSVGAVTTNDTPGSWTAITINVTDTTVVANGGLFIHFDGSASGLAVGEISVTYDHP
jgi:hypothetical protein